MRTNRIILILLSAAFFSSCKITQTYRQPAGIADIKLYRDVTTRDTVSMASLSWVDLFSDQYLQALIREGINNNLDRKIALARIRAASANFNQSRLALLPGLDANAVAAFQHFPSSQFGIPQTYQLSLSSGWEADIWGKFSSTKRAFLASLLQSEAFERAVQTQLVADIATNYYLLLAYDAQLQITEKTVAVRKSEVETMTILKESNRVTGAAVVQSAANRYSVEITLPDIKQNIRETENTISILLGKAPDTVLRSSLDEQLVAKELKTGIPALLLANRPDVQAAEYQLRNSFELVNVSRTYFYPALSITASTGLSNTSLAPLIGPASFFASITGGLLQPVFNQGLNKQRLALAQARMDEDLAAFKHTLLTAGQEVSNALFSYQAAVEKEALRTQQTNFLLKSVDYTQELLRYSSAVNYTDVLTSEQSLLSAQLSSISDKLQQLTAVVTLYRSLGGGWK